MPPLSQLSGRMSKALRPLNVSRPDGSRFSVDPPSRSRVPQGVRLGEVRETGSRREVGSRRDRDRMLGGIDPSQFIHSFPRMPDDGGLLGSPPPPTDTGGNAPRIPGQGGGGGVQAEPGGEIISDPLGPPPPPDVPGAGGAPAPPQVPGVPPGVNPVTGEEVPFTVAPPEGESELLGQLRSTASRNLRNPGVFDDDVFQRSLDAGRRAVNEDLARRGILDSSFGTELFAERVMLPMQRERLNRLSSARQQAFQQGLGTEQFSEQLGASRRGELRGERQFLEQLRNQARQQAIQEAGLAERFRTNRESQFQQLLAQALGLTSQIPGLSTAGQLAGSAAAGHGQQAQAQSSGLGGLAQLAGLAFGLPTF